MIIIYYATVDCYVFEYNTDIAVKINIVSDTIQQSSILIC